MKGLGRVRTVGSNRGLAAAIGVAFDESDQPVSQDEFIDIVRNGLGLALDRTRLSGRGIVVGGAESDVGR